ncbi:MAG: ribonuclease Z [Clostridiales bacterium]|jgi:ribonuclease Z|nr:ribonuclease Z [Clostridiales bacterium]
MLDVALLGSGGMMPLPNRFLTALLCRLNGKMALTDCGEGTQVSLKMLGWGFKNIDLICFTHFHADHIAGLPGLLLTIGNAERSDPILIAGPPGLERVVRGLCVIAPELPFDMRFLEMSADAPDSFTYSGFNVSTQPMAHRIPCLGWSFEAPRLGKFDVERAKSLNLPVRLWSKLQKEGYAEYEGNTYTGDMVMGPARKSVKLTYCTDSRPFPALADFARGADLFICEGLYGDDDKYEKTVERRHMLFSEAARVARDANVGELWLTHFSPALTDPKEFLPNAAAIFPNSKIGRDRKTAFLSFED